MSSDSLVPETKVLAIASHVRFLHFSLLFPGVVILLETNGMNRSFTGMSPELLTSSLKRERGELLMTGQLCRQQNGNACYAVSRV